ncbi:MAG: hypothetical protein WEA09_00950 [Gemmatimonadota bacterium]
MGSRHATVFKEGPLTVEGQVGTERRPVEVAEYRPWRSESEAQLRALYHRYCTSQGAALTSLLPREAVRPLYREALARRGASTSDDAGGSNDPMGLLAQHCASILPLPPFQVWVRDFQAHRMEYLEALAKAVGPQGRSEPVEVEAIPFLSGRQQWVAGLQLFRDGDAWRGFIAFTPQAGQDQLAPEAPGRSQTRLSSQVRTADIFREQLPGEVRNRFRDLSPAALHAFLRSSLP